MGATPGEQLPPAGGRCQAAINAASNTHAQLSNIFGGLTSAQIWNMEGMTLLPGGIAFSLEQTPLQELPYAGQFDAVLTIDAMEHIPPEDWPGVLANLRRAARPSGLLYLTVEELERHHLEQAFASLSARGLPAVRVFVRRRLASPDAGSCLTGPFGTARPAASCGTRPANWG